MIKKGWVVTVTICRLIWGEHLGDHLRQTNPIEYPGDIAPTPLLLFSLIPHIYRPPHHLKRTPFGTFALSLPFGLAITLCVQENAIAQTAVLTCPEMERIALMDHPVLSEKSLEVDKAREKIRDLDMGVILPRFEIETGMGPAPGIREVRSVVPTESGNDAVEQFERRLDFGEWGPFFGIQARVVQPLNIGRYRAARRAATLNTSVSEASFHKERIEVSEEAQTICYQRLYALTMQREMRAARDELDRAQQRMSDRLDDGDESISQTDVLQIRAGRYSLDQGLNEANLGVQRSALALRFLLARPDDDTTAAVLGDSVLTIRNEALPELNALKLAALRNHPDLTRLRHGLAARQELLKVAQGEIGPDIFLFGSFEYSKAWSSDRQSGGGDPFARDPLNELSGVAGLGMRLQLNFWSRYQGYRRERINLRQLERTEVYAARGILLRVEDAYLRALKARTDVEDAQRALRAAEAWLKGAAMRYDLDPDEASGLIAPFRQSILTKRDYYKAVLEYNLAVAAVYKATGWTLSDYLGTLTASSPDTPSTEDQP
jgi:outer membrane protein TolC